MVGLITLLTLAYFVLLMWVVFRLKFDQLCLESGDPRGSFL